MKDVCKVCSLLKWRFIISIEVSSNHFELRRRVLMDVINMTEISYILVGQKQSSNLANFPLSCS